MRADQKEGWQRRGDKSGAEEKRPKESRGGRVEQRGGEQSREKQ
jgi:hypothetical protein